MKLRLRLILKSRTAADSLTDRAGYRLVMFLLIMGLPAAILLVSPEGARADTREDIIAASDAATIQVRQALKDEDSGRLASIFTSNGTVISSGGRTVQGRSTIRASAALLFMTLGSGELVSSRTMVSVVDSLGYETGRFAFKRGSETNQGTAFAGQYVIVWKLEEGDWKVATLIGLP